MDEPALPQTSIAGPNGGRATVSEMEAGLSGFGDQEPIPSHGQCLLVKSYGRERRGNVGTMIPARKVERESASEQTPAERRKRFRRFRNWGVTLSPGRVQRFRRY
jgi:hypothetical protein